MTAKNAKTPASNQKTSQKISQKVFHELPTARPDTPLLDRIDSPNDLRMLSYQQLGQLVDELRAFLLYSTAVSGGHFGANLGVIELTIALHYVFDTPNDQLVWDVGHQAYPHKILTGRRERLTSIRAKDGLTAFPERHESKFDTFGVGHSSTAISAALGMSLAMRHLANTGQAKRHKAIAVVGDGAMTGGMAFEAMNDAVQQNADIIVVLNDNDMSISQATGGFSKHLATLWQRGLAVDIDKNNNPIITKRTISSDDRRIRHYLHMANEALDDWTLRIPKKISEKLAEKGLPTPSQLETLPEKIANRLIDEVFPENLFKAIGFQYFGPFDGHDVGKLTQVFERVKQLDGAVLVHVHTTKGKGFAPAENDPITYHAIAKLKQAEKPTAAPIKSNAKKFSDVFGEFICDTAKTDKNLMAITPAMAEGSGMVKFASQFPEQFFDVAIAEQHAVTLAGGMATQGVKPIVAIYSTFLQRGYDQLIHDIALQNLDVMFAIDRAGLVGEDGATHAGVFDIAYMRTLPNIVIATPKDENESYNLLKTCYAYQGVTAVRYPRGQGVGVEIIKNSEPYPIGKAVLEMTLNPNGNRKIALLAFGTMTYTALTACENLTKQYPDVAFSVYNMRFVKPLDHELLNQLLAQHYTIITLEEHQLMGGAGSGVNEYLLAAAIEQQKPSPTIFNIGIADEYIPHGSHEQQLAYCGLDVEGITAKIQSLLKTLI